MKTTILLLLVLISGHLFAQVDTLGKSKYKCEVYRFQQRLVVGDLYQLGDTSIVIKEKVKDNTSYSKSNFELMPLPVSSIDNIIVRRKGSVANGFIIGGLSGMFLGGLLGYASASSQSSVDGGIMVFTEGESAVIGGIFGFIPGAIIGLIAGSHKFNYGIHGKKERYDKWKGEMNSYLVVH